MSVWFEIVAVGVMHLWRDEPAASTLQLAVPTSTLEALIEALPTTKPLENKRYRELIAEVKSTRGAVRSVRVSLTVKNPSSATAELYTGNGEGDWIQAGDVIRIVAIDEPA